MKKLLAKIRCFLSPGHRFQPTGERVIISKSDTKVFYRERFVCACGKSISAAQIELI